MKDKDWDQARAHHHCVHPFDKEDGAPAIGHAASIFWCCEEGCDDVFLGPPAGIEEKTHGGLVFLKARVLHPWLGPSCSLCGHPILGHTDLVHDWEHGCTAKGCMCSGHVECVGCATVGKDPFVKPGSCSNGCSGGFRNY